MRTFDGPLATIEDRHTLWIGWYGTASWSTDGYNAQMVTQANLPEVGSHVTVEAWRNRGYVQLAEPLSPIGRGIGVGVVLQRPGSG